MLFALLSSVALSSVGDVLPDVTLLPSFLAQAYVSTDNPELSPGARALRFPTASYNIGAGRLELRGAEVVGEQQRVYQRVYRSDNTFYDRACGWFIYHPTHQHIHFEDWTQFLLRDRKPDGSVGNVIATGAKTSFCILEILKWDPSLQGHDQEPSFDDCGQIQGLRPGWADVYGATLPGQYIELSNIPDGDYYLEGFIDPNGLVLESNESNNHVLVPLAIGTPPAATADDYESNNSISQVDAKPEGGKSSANFGYVTTKKVVRTLSMSDSADWFKFKTIRAGGEGDYIRIESPWMNVGNLDLQLYNSAGALLTTAATAINYEQISLENRPAGTYYVKVVRSTAVNNPRYWLTLNPAGGNPPIGRVDPPSIQTRKVGPYVQRSLETIPIRWEFGAQSTSAQKVTLFRSKTKDASGAVSIDGFESIPGHVKAANILTNQFPPGKWYIFARFDSGGGHTDSWKADPLTIYVKGDTNFDGKVTVEEAQQLYHEYLKTGKKLPIGWDVVCDMNSDGKVDEVDYRAMYKLAEHRD